MIRLWTFRDHPILYRDKSAAEHEAEGSEVLSYTLDGMGKTVSNQDFYKAIDIEKGLVIDLFSQGIPFVKTHHTLTGDMYLVNAETAGVVQTYKTNPKRRKRR